MLAKLPGFMRVPLVMLLLALNIVVHVTPLFLLTLFKVILPIRGIRLALSRGLVLIAESWIAFNSAMFDWFTRTRWQVDGLNELRYNGNYLVLCNHQSWVDIPVLQKIFNRRIPFLRFFLKSQLIWVPLLGPAWWALDFPFMKRYSKETLAAHPELQGKDMEATRRACEKFRHMPVSVMNFVEGTRFTPEKQQTQASPFQHLLKPKAGAMAMALNAMGAQFHSLVDATIAYPDGIPTFWQYLCGQAPRVLLKVRQVEIPVEFCTGDYENDRALRKSFHRWLDEIWQRKDADMTEMLAC